MVRFLDFKRSRTDQPFREPGLSIIYCPGNEPSASAEADIILVPGLGGGSFTTWEGSDGTVWPKDFLHKTVPKARVLVYHYNTSPRGTTSAAGLRDHAKDLLADIRDERYGDPALKLRPIIFVCHSLGGIVAKRAIREAYQKRDYRSVWEATRGIMFFATPHFGIDEVVWKDFLRRVLHADAARVHAKPSKRIIEDVEANSGVLAAITEDFKSLQRDLVFSTFIEDTPIKGLSRLLVDSFRGRMHCDTERHQTLSGDHMGICKFEASEETQFRPVHMGIRWMLEQSPKALDKISLEARAALSLLCSDTFHCYLLNQSSTEGTCEWIEKQAVFKAWHANVPGKQRLLIQGKPGTGKSFLAKHIITASTLLQDSEVIHCFLTSSLPERCSLNGLLRATLHQALRLAPALITTHLQILVDIQQTDVGDQEVVIEYILRMMWGSIMAEVAANVKLTFVIDGLECLPEAQQQEFLSCLQEFNEKIKDRLGAKFLFLSREDQGHSQKLSEAGFEQYTVTVQDTENDILTSIKSNLSRVWHHLKLPADAYEDVCEKIAQGSKGMYHWSDLVVSELSRRLITDRDQLISTVDTFSKGIEYVYTSSLERIFLRATLRPFVRQALRWACFQQERLKEVEFNFGQALGVWIDNRSDGNSTPPTFERLLEDNIIVSVDLYCGPLVRFVDGHLELMHSSLKHYLTEGTNSEFHLDAKESHAALANICIEYLASSRFQDSGLGVEVIGMDLWESKVRQRMHDNPFLRYASLYWYKHLEEAGEAWSSTRYPPSALLRAVLEDPTTHYSRSWTEVWWFCKRGPVKEYPKDCPSDQIASPSFASVPALQHEHLSEPTLDPKITNESKLQSQAQFPSLSGHVMSSPSESPTTGATDELEPVSVPIGVGSDSTGAGRQVGMQGHHVLDPHSDEGLDKDKDNAFSETTSITGGNDLGLPLTPAGEPRGAQDQAPNEAETSTPLLDTEPGTTPPNQPLLGPWSRAVIATYVFVATLRDIAKNPSGVNTEASNNPRAPKG